jgi:apolipoprotein N-acyltransferase
MQACHFGSAHPGAANIAGQRAAVLICYEQMIPWPMLTSMLGKPTVLVAISNLYWFAGTPIPRFQACAVRAWSRLFDVPLYRTVNF